MVRSPHRRNEPGPTTTGSVRLVNAHPASAALATIIDAAPDDVAWQPLLADGHDDPALSPLCALLDEIPDAPQNLAIYREWLPLVRRFTFEDTI